MEYLDNALSATNLSKFIKNASKNKDKTKENLYYFYPSLLKLIGQEEDTKISQIIDSSDLSQVKLNRLKLLEDLYFIGDNRNQNKIIQDISDTLKPKEGETSSVLDELKEKLKNDPLKIETLSTKREGKRYLSKIKNLANTYKKLLDKTQDEVVARSLSSQETLDAVMPVEEKIKRIKATSEEKKQLMGKLEEVKKKLPNVSVNVKKLQDNIRKMIRSRSAKSISKQMDEVRTEIARRQDETIPTTTEQAPKQEDLAPKQIMTDAPTMTMDSKPPKMESKPADKLAEMKKLRGKKGKMVDDKPVEPSIDKSKDDDDKLMLTMESKPADKLAEMKKQPKLRGKKGKMVDDKPVEPSIDKSKDDDDKLMLGMPSIPDLPSKPKKADKPKKKQPAKVDDQVPITLDKTRDEEENIPPPPPSTPPEPPSISLNRPTKERKDKVTDVEEDKLPTKVDFISKKRLSSEDKSLQELKADIDYFFKNFPDKLRRIKKTKSNNIEVVRRFHKRIVALLKVDMKEDKKNIGVVIKGSDFIKEKLKEIILENSINGLSAEDLLVNIEGEPVEGKTDAGSYEFKTNKTSGKTYAKNEPVFRYIPQTEPPKPQRKINRIPNPKTMFRSQYTTARKEVAKNPFLTARQPSIKLKTLY